MNLVRYTHGLSKPTDNLSQQVHDKIKSVLSQSVDSNFNGILVKS